MSTIKDIFKEYFSPKGILLTVLTVLTIFVGKNVLPKYINKSIDILNSIDKSSDYIVQSMTSDDFIVVNFSNSIKIFCERVPIESLSINKGYTENKQVVNIRYSDRSTGEEKEIDVNLRLLPNRKFISFHNEPENMYYVYFKDDCGIIHLYKKPGESLEPAVV